MKVINLLGAPCSGKSTVAAGLFYLMKMKNYNVELVQEFVKKEVYANNRGSLSDQLFLTASQNHLLHNLKDKVDYVICDASLINGAVYDMFYKQQNNFMSTLYQTLYHQYDNINFLLPQKDIYINTGRSQTKEEAKYIHDLFKFVINNLGLEVINLENLEREDIPNIMLALIELDCTAKEE